MDKNKFDGPLDRENVLWEAIAEYGELAQVDMCVEECSELIKALLKARRAGEHADTASIIDEIADVQIMLDQMRMIFGDSAEREAYKVRRLAERLGLLEGQHGNI